MAVKLRLKRMGAKKRPFYRIVASDARSARDGKSIELIGTYDPLSNPSKIIINKDLAIKWLNYGAQMTDTVKNLFQGAGILTDFNKSKKGAKKENTTNKKSEKTEAKKVEIKKEPTKKTVVKKETPKKSGEKKEAPKKTVVKKETPKKSETKKTEPKKDK